MSKTSLKYLTGFGNQHQSEAVRGALPRGRNSPQIAPMGLYAEQISGTAFTQPRRDNRRSWVYRIIPSARHGAFRQIGNGLIRSAPFTETVPDPNRLRWDPLPEPDAATDFIDGLVTYGGNGDTLMHAGIALHLYHANRDMTDRYFVNADGEFLIVPESGSLHLHTELGRLHVAPGAIAVIPRGIRFRVELPDGRSRGYVCENYGPCFTLPERGPIGANGLANERDFEIPTAAFEEAEGTAQVVQKYCGNLWAADYDHSPLDVLAWHGNYTPYRYSLSDFMTINTVSYDHPDPSIFTVLASPSDTPGLANVDFMIFPPRWLVAENTFRPAWFHRNVMSEFMGLVDSVNGSADRLGGFAPGGANLHNSFSSHGPDAETYQRESTTQLLPEKAADALAFMFESRWPIVLTAYAMNARWRQQDYDTEWDGLQALSGGSQLMF